MGHYSGPEHKTKILKLFRSLLRERLKLPTENRRQFILFKTRNEFRQHKDVVDDKKIRSLLIIGFTQLDTVIVQSKHLSSILDRELTDFEKRKNVDFRYYKQQKEEPTDKSLQMGQNIFKQKTKKKKPLDDESNIN
ncbi:hypothetical protein DLAC_11564 [Tieghemostelium lacteum]|uniref:Complex 1 LYR protein domain-containing protein n=1 Tax=Tieghemostelium lacteum TaxID=361077 RepID=A0A152A0Y5_TIELA|nr:hypothetical protein DLAC_11564 [Tieghemostelium lacteum]|eukprot:KYQ99863.1 hypothetical protein DLAC_11564 [Tieghemostelium lacteum]